MAPAKVQKRSTKSTKPQGKKITKAVEKVVEKKKKGKKRQARDLCISGVLNKLALFCVIGTAKKPVKQV